MTTPATPQDIPTELRIQLCYWYYKGNGQTYFDANMANAAFNGDKHLQELEQILHQSNREAKLEELKALDALPENRFKFTLDEMHRAIHKRISELEGKHE